MNLGMCFTKIAPRQVGAFAWYTQGQNSRYFRCPVWKTKSWQKANIHENWNMKTSF